MLGSQIESEHRGKKIKKWILWRFNIYQKSTTNDVSPWHLL